MATVRLQTRFVSRKNTWFARNWKRIVFAHQHIAEDAPPNLEKFHQDSYVFFTNDVREILSEEDDFEYMMKAHEAGMSDLPIHGTDFLFNGNFFLPTYTIEKIGRHKVDSCYIYFAGHSGCFRKWPEPKPLFRHCLEVISPESLENLKLKSGELVSLQLKPIKIKDKIKDQLDDLLDKVKDRKNRIF